MGRLSWVRWFPDDYDGGTRFFTNEQLGVFQRLLHAQFSTKHTQALPDDVVALESVARGEVPRCVLEKFDRVSVDGRQMLRNQRFAEEYWRAEREYDGKSRGGKRKVSSKDTGQQEPKLPGIEPEPEYSVQPATQPVRSETDAPTGVIERAKAIPKKPNPVSLACDIWDHRWGEGSAPGGQLAREGTRLAKKHGWATVLRALQRYVLETRHPSPNPSHFRQHFGDYLPDGRGERRGGKPSMVDETNAGLGAWLEGKGASVAEEGPKRLEALADPGRESLPRPSGGTHPEGTVRGRGGRSGPPGGGDS